jgi:hypothetical protein
MTLTKLNKKGCDECVTAHKDKELKRPNGGLGTHYEKGKYQLHRVF